MARLPQPGGDDGTWGDVLNDFLDEAHNLDGSLKTSSVSTALPDATSVTKGKLRLTGDLGGTADAPTVPGLASRITASSTDTLTNKTITAASNNVAANSLKSTTTNVDVAAASAPASGQFLRASNGTAATWVALPRMFGWFLEGQLVVGDGQGPIYRIDSNVTILGFDISCKIAPTGSAAIFDVEVGATPNGIFTTIFSSQPQIAATQNIGTGGTLSTTTLNAGQYVRFNVDLNGTGTAAEGATGQLRMETR